MLCVITHVSRGTLRFCACHLCTFSPQNHHKNHHKITTNPRNHTTNTPFLTKCQSPHVITMLHTKSITILLYTLPHSHTTVLHTSSNSLKTHVTFDISDVTTISIQTHYFTRKRSTSDVTTISHATIR